MHDRRRWWALTVLCMVIFIASIDNTILNVALPTLVRDLDASTSELQWIVDSYLLVFAGLLLTTGALADRFGRARAMRVGLVIFGVSSAVAAWSASAGGLIACRAVMGIGAAVTVPCTMSILVNIFHEPRERRFAIGMITSVGGLGLGLGPIVGGSLLSHFWWGSVFLVNVPIVALVYVASTLVVPDSKNPRPGRVDPLGVVLSIVGVSSFVYAFVEAPEQGWTSRATLVAFAAAFVVLGLFVGWELRCPHPMLDLSFFADARFSAANGSLVTASFGYTGLLFVLTQVLQFVQGYTPLQVGVRLVPLSVLFTGMGFLAPRWADRIGDARAVAMGLVGFSLGLLTLAQLGVEPDYALLLGGFVLVGFGYGSALAPATDAIMSSVPREKAGLASGTSNTTRQLGTAVGVAVVGSLTSSGYRSEIERRAADLRLPAGTVEASKESVGAALAAARDLGGVTGRALATAAREAFVHGMRFGLVVASGVLVVGAAVAGTFLPRGRLGHPAEPAPAAVAVAAGGPE